MERPFSERIGATGPSKALQLDEMDDALRNSLWNVIAELFETPDDEGWNEVAAAVARRVLKTPADEFAYWDGYECRKWLRERFMQLKWHEVYDLVEHVACNHEDMVAPGGVTIYAGGGRPDPYAMFNDVFEREHSGYRFISGVLTSIAHSAEVAEIEQAIEESDARGLLGATVHIRAALDFFGRRPVPDCRNAVKEAVSAVESVASKIADTNRADLDAALRKIAKAGAVHPVLKVAFVKLFAYASDEDGVRHAILDEVEVGFDEAKFMVVACSAFVNYLIAKADAAGLLEG